MSLKEVVDLIYAHTRPDGGCLVTTRAKDPSGYGAQKFNGKKYNAHALVARYYLGPRPEGKEVRHLCGRKDCVAASHLRYGTGSENSHDAIRHGTHSMLRDTTRGRISDSLKGRPSPHRMFTEEQVAKIRKMYEEGGWTYRTLAPVVGCKFQTLGAIIRGEKYK